MVTMNLLQYTVYNSHLSYTLKHGNITTPINQPKVKTDTEMAKLDTESVDTELTMNSDNFFASLGMVNMTEFMRQAAQRGKQAVMEKTGEYASDRRKLGKITTGITPAKLYTQKRFAEFQPKTVVAKQTAPIDVHFSKPEIEGHYTPARVSQDWSVERAKRQYTASQFSGRVDQWPRIDLQYTGVPLKTPHSANTPVNQFIMPLDEKV